MCEALVIIDTRRALPNAYKAGDIVVVVEDGHQWSTKELTHPFWRVVKIPGLPASALREFDLSDSHSPHRKLLRLRVESALGALLRAGGGSVTLTPRTAFAALTDVVATS